MGKISLSENGQVTIQGDLNADTVMTLWPDYKSELVKLKQLKIRLNSIEKFDTAGLAWLLQLKGECQKLGISFSLINTPSNIESLAKISNVEELLSIN